MKTIVTKSYDEMSKTSADFFESEIRNNPEIVIGLATGSTPVGTYKELVRRHMEKGLDFSRVKSFNLDEYLGLSGDNPNSYRHFMNEQLFNHINIDKNNTHVPEGLTEDPKAYGEKYDQMITESGGIRIQLLGIGSNGHIAFNEPDDELPLGTGLVELSEQTIEDNARFFQSIDQVPTQAISMGMGSIMKAEKIIILASGEGKAEVISKLLNSGKVTSRIPATFLLLHPDVTLICDEEAYSGVSR
ncbi:glucosamine-6-phosphate deaminase [Gudongella sp. DL1XJH-153]|uniref:glucosamine-6-phosphate deaminase n=1 Tax=Gudongella sp. DL1XJH-153 TaxID=3409804 RepID=UPI003BB64FE5